MNLMILIVQFYMLMYLFNCYKSKKVINYYEKK